MTDLDVQERRGVERDNGEVDAPCAVCAASDWEHIRPHVYRPAQDGLSDYERLRRRVLFEIWWPGAGEVHLEVVACRECGFMCYSPRPTVDDIAAKYRFLQEHERSIGGSMGGKRGAERDRKRAERTLSALRLREPSRVLDFGGGNGKLLAPFRDAGHDCYLVDYNTQPLAGVTKLADTLEHVDAQFDAIVCSHVLEHVADPLATLGELRTRLRPGGCLYAEVPSEVWRGVPIARDPVTHVNFFTVSSFERLFSRAGLVAHARERTGSYGAQRKPVIVTVARLPDGIAETRRRLNPAPVDWVLRGWRSRRLPARLRSLLPTLMLGG